MCSINCEESFQRQTLSASWMSGMQKNMDFLSKIFSKTLNMSHLLLTVFSSQERGEGLLLKHQSVPMFGNIIMLRKNLHLIYNYVAHIPHQLKALPAKLLRSGKERGYTVCIFFHWFQSELP